MKINPYLAFNGQCREAFTFYAQVLGGTITFMQTNGESPMAAHVPAAFHDRVMHASIEVGDQVLQGADAPTEKFTQPAGFSVALHFETAAEGERVFKALSDGATIRMPYQETFWAKGFGMLIDRFGTPWIVNAGQITG